MRVQRTEEMNVILEPFILVGMLLRLDVLLLISALGGLLRCTFRILAAGQSRKRPMALYK